MLAFSGRANSSSAGPGKDFFLRNKSCKWIVVNLEFKARRRGIIYRNLLNGNLLTWRTSRAISGVASSVTDADKQTEAQTCSLAFKESVILQEMGYGKHSTEAWKRGVG